MRRKLPHSVLAALPAGTWAENRRKLVGMLRAEHNPLVEKLGWRAWRNTRSVAVRQDVENGKQTLAGTGDW